jgi:hypothetical protein
MKFRYIRLLAPLAALTLFTAGLAGASPVATPEPQAIKSDGVIYDPLKSDGVIYDAESDAPICISARGLDTTDENTVNVSCRPTRQGGGPGVESLTIDWTLYTSQVPDQTLAAAPGWEVGTDFTSSIAGRVIGFRFWRSANETGDNYAKLWAPNGSQLKKSKKIQPGTGWVDIYLDSPVSISANTTYRASVNTNNEQVKRGGAYVFDGPITNGPLTSTTGYYGQPIDSRPTSSSASYFFVDVIFEETVPQPNLVIQFIQANLWYLGQEYVRVQVCNIGNAAAGASYTNIQFVRLPNGGGGGVVFNNNYSVPALAAGGCHNHDLQVTTWSNACNNFHAYADITNVVVESNENDNSRSLVYCK